MRMKHSLIVQVTSPNLLEIAMYTTQAFWTQHFEDYGRTLSSGFELWDGVG